MIGLTAVETAEVDGKDLERTWELICLIHQKSGDAPISHLPGTWDRKIDEHWEIRVNGHQEEFDDIPPFSIYVKFNGWPAGICDPYECTFAAGGLANLKTFNAALEALL